MPKTKSVYVCQSCGASFPKWAGQCVGCGAWNTLVETLISPRAKARSSPRVVGGGKIVSLSDFSAKEISRIKTGIEEFDRVLGGGLVPGQVVLLAGEPGVGKSTLLLQAANSLNSGVYYASGEESAYQICLRAARLKIKNQKLKILEEIDADEIVGSLLNKNIGLVIIDSIQVLTTTELEGQAGTVGQVRECAFRLSRYAKENNIPIILVGHVTKEGSIAGPKVLEHLVDTVLYLEGDKSHIFRLLSATKNRFGPVGEVGVFEMTQEGLLGVKNPSDRFLEERLRNAVGSVLTVVMEGSRPMILEVQALVAKTSFGYPRRTTSGFSLNRLLVLLAVLQARVGLNLSDKDVYLNVAAGVSIAEPAADLAVCLAVASALKGVPLADKTVAFGEVGLVGEVRRVPQMERRLKEAEKMGFLEVISPLKVRTVTDAVSNFLR